VADVDQENADIRDGMSNPVRSRPKDSGPILDHLERFRIVIIESLAAVVIAGIICFVFATRIFDLLRIPLHNASATAGFADADGLVLRSVWPAEAFVISLKVALIAGTIIASPVIFYFLWRFVRVRVEAKGKRLALAVVTAAATFFFVGIAFCYFLVLPLCLLFFWQYNARMGIAPEWTVDSYMSFSAMLLLSFGLVFEMPVVAAVLAKLGVLSSEVLVKNFWYAAFIIFIIAAILTPPDIMSQILLGVPMMGLYGLSIWAAKVFARRAHDR
jgi:sec-independent protein translocase protein TatC